jgi:N utilization substance protein B
MADKRTRARQLAMQALYQLDIQGEDAMVWLGRFFAEEEPDQQIRQLADNWARQTWQNRQVCDELISACARRWRLDRLSPVDRAILRLGVYQLRFCEDIPSRVAINESIELAKIYSSEQSPGFINGVLDAVFKKIKTTTQTTD